MQEQLEKGQVSESKPLEFTGNWFIDATTNNKIFEFLKKLEFNKYAAKSNGESLLMHSYNAYFLASKIIIYIPNLSDLDKKKIILSALLHDFGKTYSEFQNKLHGAHKLKDEDIPKLKKIIDEHFKIRETEADDIIYAIRNHHNVDMENVNSQRAKITRIVSICDNIVSNEDIEESVNLISSLIDSIEYECFSIEMMNHPISSYVIGSFDYIFHLDTIEPILFAKNGTIFIRNKKHSLPTMEKVNEFLNERINDEFLSEGILKFDNTNNRIYTTEKDFLQLAQNHVKFLDFAQKDINRRLNGFKKNAEWGEEKEKTYLLGRVCGSVHNALIDILKLDPRAGRAPFSSSLGGRADSETVEFIERIYGKGVSYILILEKILKKFSQNIQEEAKKILPYNVKDLLIMNAYNFQPNLDIQKEAKNDYIKYWEKNPIGICEICHTFGQEPASASLFPNTDLGGKTDVFITGLMRRPVEVKKKRGVCRWCKLWFMLLKSKTGGNWTHKICIVPHALFGRVNWEEIFPPSMEENIGIISIGSTTKNYIYPHIAVIGLSGKTYSDFIFQCLKNGILDKLYDTGLRGKVVSTLVEPTFYLFDCGGIKLTPKEYKIYKALLQNLRKHGQNYYAMTIINLQNNPYSWGTLIKTNKVEEGQERYVVEAMGEISGFSFLKNIWIGGGENRASNAAKIVRRMNESLRKLKDKENKETTIDSMISIGRKMALSTRDFRDWADNRKDEEIKSLRVIAEKLYEYKENSSQRTELIRAMECYLGYIPYTIEGVSNEVPNNS